ncbi:uncharacterized protein LOC120832296 isoform X3 [Scomber scombrus]|uniref:Uncharacterized protein LOC120832296 isoform X3 n=1 Tax=Scomber scombrus TaxID=13677 RepID=A0AAV1NM85_SCOSC
MRFLVPLFVFLAVAAFQSALSASLESSDKEGKVLYDGIAELQKIDQMEFEAAQKSEVAQMNVTEEQNEDGRYLEAAQDGSVEEPIEVGVGKTAVGGGKPDAAVHEESESESSEEADGEQMTMEQLQRLWTMLMKPGRIQPRNKIYWSEKAEAAGGSHRSLSTRRLSRIELTVNKKGTIPPICIVFFFHVIY